MNALHALQSSIMNPDQLLFLAIVEQAEKAGKLPADWLQESLKVMQLVPDEMSADEAALAFVEWISSEPRSEFRAAATCS